MDKKYFVYFLIPKIKEPDCVKIGITQDLVKRKSSIEHASGRRLCCVWALPCESKEMALAIEKMLHSTFKEHRLRGEWFRFCPDIWEWPSYLEKTTGLNGFDHDGVEFKMRGDVSHILEASQA